MAKVRTWESWSCVVVVEAEMGFDALKSLVHLEPHDFVGEVVAEHIVDGVAEAIDVVAEAKICRVVVGKRGIDFRVSQRRS